MYKQYEAPMISMATDEATDEPLKHARLWEWHSTDSATAPLGLRLPEAWTDDRMKHQPDRKKSDKNL